MLMRDARIFSRRWCKRLFPAVAPLLIGLFWAAPGRAADGDALAVVNGQPISRKEVVDKLIETHGLAVLQQMIALDLAKQETQRRGLTVTAADIQDQFDRALAEIVPTSDAQGVALTPESKQQALERILQERCLTMPEFRMAMERNAHLRKLVESDFTVDESTLREEFARLYGEKVEVRHIQLAANDTRALNEALDELSHGTDFAEVARRISINQESAARGGLMEPFTFTDKDIPAALRDYAFSLSVGQVSAPLQTGQYVHILKLERRIPPSDVKFEDVRLEVERQLRARVERKKMNELITRLFQQAKIRVLDPKLKVDFEKLLEDFKAGRAGSA
jgi:foldase protein PrsA